MLSSPPPNSRHADEPATISTASPPADRSAITGRGEDCIIAIDAQGRLTAFDAAAERTLGYRREHAIGLSLAETLLPPAARDQFLSGLHELQLAAGPSAASRRLEMNALRADGHQIPVELTLTRAGSGASAGYTGVLRHRRRGADLDLAGATRPLHMLVQANQAVLHAYSEPALLSEICRIAVEVGAYRMAGVGYCERHGEGVRLRNVAAFGDTSPLEGLGESRFDDGPGARAVRTGQPVVVADLSRVEWRFGSLETLLARGYRSAISLPLRNEQGSFGVLGLCTSEPFSAGEAEIGLLQRLADNLAFGIGVLRARADRLRAEWQRSCMQRELADSLARQQSLSRRLVEVRELEQQKLSAELHDRIGQELTALSINLNIIDDLAPATLGGRLSARLSDSRRLLDSTIAAVRDVIAELRPPALDEYGLLAGLRGYCAQLQARAGINVLVDGEEPSPRLGGAVEAALFRIAQEALTNTVKHGCARSAHLRLSSDGIRARLAIDDDGIGFDPALVARRRLRGSWGLELMRERAEAVGGEFTVQSRPGGGTHIVVEVTRTP